MAGRSPWGWLTNTIWGSPARKVTTVLMGAVVTPIWVLNLETLAAENGWNRLLVDPGPVSSLAAGALSILFSTQFQWAVIGAFTAIVVDGWFRFRTKEPDPDFAALYDVVTRALRRAGFAMTREQRDSSAIGEVESAYHALEKLGLPVPDRGDSPDKHFMHAFHYLGVVAPLIRDGHIEKARELAAEAIRSLNASEGKPPT